MNPWKLSVFQVFRTFIRFVLWLCLAINAGMLGLFSICFTHQFLSHLWRWLLRTLFSEEW